jgi:hypothetical protein
MRTVTALAAAVALAGGLCAPPSAISNGRPVSSSVLLAALATPNTPLVRKISSANGAASSLRDYLIMDVCTDAKGKIVQAGKGDINPVTCAHHRDLRPGEAVPYYHADYPFSNDANPCHRFGQSREYSFPLQKSAIDLRSVYGTDQKNTKYPLMIAWNDLPSRHRSATGRLPTCTWNVFSVHDHTSVIALGGGYATLTGSFKGGGPTTPGSGYSVALGAKYADPTVTGVARFLPAWSFPEHIPALNSVYVTHYANGGVRLGTTTAEIKAFSPHDSSVRRESADFTEHLMVRYGSASSQTRPLESLMYFGFATINQTKDGPEGAASVGHNAVTSERLYLTRELGYVTRWELWHSDLDPKAVERAQIQYERANCNMPQNIAGQISPHFGMGPVILKSAADPITGRVGNVYEQVYTTMGADASIHTWYFIGCHDYSNVHPQSETSDPAGASASFAPSSVVNAALYDGAFLYLFGAVP